MTEKCTIIGETASLFLWSALGSLHSVFPGRRLILWCRFQYGCNYRAASESLRGVGGVFLFHMNQCWCQAEGFHPGDRSVGPALVWLEVPQHRLA